MKSHNFLYYMYNVWCLRFDLSEDRGRRVESEVPWQSACSSVQWYSRVQIYFCNIWRKELLLEFYDLTGVKSWSKWHRFGTSARWTTTRESVVWPRFGAGSASCSVRIKVWIMDWAIPVTWRIWITSGRGWTTVHFLTWTTWITACSMASIFRSSRTWCSPPTCSEVKINIKIHVARQETRDF